MKKPTKKRSNVLATSPAAPLSPAEREARSEDHFVQTSVALYERALTGTLFFDENMRETSIQFIRDLKDKLRPRDPLEMLLVQQMLVQHARYLGVTKMANASNNIEHLDVLHEAADRAANGFRRQLMTLKEYRQASPPITGNINVEQLNLVKQALLQINNGTAPEKTDAPNKIQATEALPDHGGGPAGQAPARGDGEAVAMGDGAEDGGRQGDRLAQRDQARAAVRRRRGASANCG